jgi:hypothetical protein
MTDGFALNNRRHADQDRPPLDFCRSVAHLEKTDLPMMGVEPKRENKFAETLRPLTILGCAFPTVTANEASWKMAASSILVECVFKFK